MTQIEVVAEHTAPPRARHSTGAGAVRSPLFVWPIVAMIAMLPVLALLVVLLLT
jgi:hypothetical protein